MNQKSRSLNKKAGAVDESEPKTKDTESSSVDQKDDEFKNNKSIDEKKSSSDKKRLDKKRRFEESIKDFEKFEDQIATKPVSVVISNSDKNENKKRPRRASASKN